MLNLRKNQAAFTLIELLVVVIIVAVLAAVGVPLLSANVQRARLTEADAGLGTIRTGMRAYFAENNTYVGATLANIGVRVTAHPDATGDLDGRFFDDNDYAFGTVTGTAFCAQVTGGLDPDTAIRAADVTTTPVTVRSIDQNGTIANVVCP